MERFRIAEGNPGAMTFLVTAYRLAPIAAEAAFKRMKENSITGAKLYMLWNDCCDRDTYIAMQVMTYCSIEKINEHINYENGRGIPFTAADILEA